MICKIKSSIQKVVHKKWYREFVFIQPQPTYCSQL